jgi:hypothetical protein
MAEERERERRRGTCGAPSMSENPIPSKLIFAETSYAIVSSTDMYESKLCRNRGSSNMKIQHLIFRCRRNGILGLEEIHVSIRIHNAENPNQVRR